MTEPNVDIPSGEEEEIIKENLSSSCPLFQNGTKMNHEITDSINNNNGDIMIKIRNLSDDNDENDDVGDGVGVPYDWDTNEGYTPLFDTDLNQNSDSNGTEGFLLMTTSAISSNDSYDWDDNNDDEDSDHTDRYSNVKQLRAFVGQNFRADRDIIINDIVEEDAVCNAMGTKTIRSVVSDNYLEIAENALSWLELDYKRTLVYEKEQKQCIPNENNSTTIDYLKDSSDQTKVDFDALEGKGSLEVASGEVDNLTSFSLSNGYQQNENPMPIFTEESEIPLNSLNNDFSEDVVQSTIDNNMHGAASTSTHESKPQWEIDAKAVRRAVERINLHDRNKKFNSKYEKWSEQRTGDNFRPVIPPSNHVLIPLKPLMAFRYSSTKGKKRKAILATANFTRSATMSEALVKLNIISNKVIQHRQRQHDDLNAEGVEELHVTPKTKETDSFSCKEIGFRIDVIGCDAIECESVDLIHTHFGPLVRWVMAFFHEQSQGTPVHLVLNLIGPNIPKHQNKAVIDFCRTSDGSRSKAFVNGDIALARCHACLYDEWIMQSDEQIKDTLYTNPDLIIAFNAGIWGYEEWKSSLSNVHKLYQERRKLKSLVDDSNQRSNRIVFVVTAYTIEEAEDDYDVIEKVLGDKNTSRISIWPPERNAFESKADRPTSSSNRLYRENAAWQAWYID